MTARRLRLPVSAGLFCTVALCGIESIAQSLPSASPRELRSYGGTLREVRLQQESPMPKWLADCDPPFYASHLLKTPGGARLRVAVFVGGTLREEESTYIPATEGTTSCRALNRAAAITIKRPASQAAGIYVDLFPVANERNEVVYLLEESRGTVAKSNAGQLLFSRTLYRVTDKGFFRVKPAVRQQAGPAADIEQLIPLASLLP